MSEDVHHVRYTVRSGSIESRDPTLLISDLGRLYRQLADQEILATSVQCFQQPSSCARGLPRSIVRCSRSHAEREVEGRFG